MWCSPPRERKKMRYFEKTSFPASSVLVALAFLYSHQKLSHIAQLLQGLILSPSLNSYNLLSVNFHKMPYMEPTLRTTSHTNCFTLVSAPVEIRHVTAGKTAGRTALNCSVGKLRSSSSMVITRFVQMFT